MMKTRLAQVGQSLGIKGSCCSCRFMGKIFFKRLVERLESINLRSEKSSELRNDQAI